MPDYQKMYIALFCAVEEAIDLLESGEQEMAEKALELLCQAQQQCEDIYVDTAE